MSEHEAQQYVDVVIEQLNDWGLIPAYGKITEDQRQKLAEMVKEKSEE